METKYYISKEKTVGKNRYLCFSDEIFIGFWEDATDLEFSKYSTITHFIERSYKEITREEFMKAYLPVNEKINNKIAEL